MILTYNSDRAIEKSAAKATVSALYDALHDTHFADNNETVAAVAAHYDDTDEDDVDEFVVSVTIERSTTDSDLVSDKDALAQTAVDLGYDATKADAKEKISLEG